MSEINRPYTAYLMDALSYSRHLRRNRNFSLSLLEIYELIPDLETSIQTELEPLEREIEKLYKDSKAGVEPGNEFSTNIEENEAIQRGSAILLRKARRQLMTQLNDAGYFEYEKTTGFHNPSKGNQPGQTTAGFKKTVKRDL